MSTEIDELAANVEILKVSAEEAINEIHSLANQLAELAGDNEELVTLAAAIKLQASALHSAVYPPSAAQG